MSPPHYVNIHILLPSWQRDGMTWLDGRSVSLHNWNVNLGPFVKISINTNKLNKRHGHWGDNPLPESWPVIYLKIPSHVNYRVRQQILAYLTHLVFVFIQQQNHFPMTEVTCDCFFTVIPTLVASLLCEKVVFDSD